jgi:hypothetical protein
MGKSSVREGTPTLRSLNSAQFRPDFNFFRADPSCLVQNLPETMVVHATKPAAGRKTAGVEKEGDIFLEIR